jgi:hypothetical protein
MIKKLGSMCKDLNFDEKMLDTMLHKGFDLDQEFVSSDRPSYPYRTVLLQEAVENNNVRMVEWLLRNGADPNVIYDDGSECVFWMMQYEGLEEHQDDDDRLHMAQLMLDHGADPLITLSDDREALFDWVAFAVFNDSHDSLWEYRSRFFILLMAYGGKSDYCTPRIVRPFDRSNMGRYVISLTSEKDGLYRGIIKDRDGTIIAHV